jgi:hypothetical protein
LFTTAGVTTAVVCSFVRSFVRLIHTRELDPAVVESVLFDRYPRGIKIEFYSRGHTTRFDWSVLQLSIVTGLSLFNLVPLIMLQVRPPPETFFLLL